MAVHALGHIATTEHTKGARRRERDERGKGDFGGNNDRSIKFNTSYLYNHRFHFAGGHHPVGARPHHSPLDPRMVLPYKDQVSADKDDFCFLFCFCSTFIFPVHVKNFSNLCIYCA